MSESENIFEQMAERHNAANPVNEEESPNPNEEEENEESEEQEEENSSLTETDDESKSAEEHTDSIDDEPIDEEEILAELEDLTYEEAVQAFDDIANSHGWEDARSMHEFRNEDIDEMSEEDVIDAYFDIIDPEASDMERELELEKFELARKSEEEIREMIDDGDITEKDWKRSVVDYQRAIRDYRDKLVEEQDSLPDLSQYEIASSDQQDNAFTDEQMQQLQDAVKSTLDKYEKEEFQITDKDGKVVAELEASISKEDRAEIEKVLTSEAGLADLFIQRDDSGTITGIDLEAQRSAAYFIMNKEKMLKAAYNEGMAQGGKSEVERIENVKTSKGSTPEAENKNGNDQTRREVLSII